MLNERQRPARIVVERKAPESGVRRPERARPAQAASTLAAAAPRMARLLMLLESESYADARPCPFCAAEEGRPRNRLAHAPHCELDGTLREAGLRSRRSSRPASG